MYELHRWCLENDMFLQKTSYQEVKMFDQIVKPVNTENHLGAVVRENLTWTANRRFSKAMRAFWYLKRKISNEGSVINK